MRAGTPLDVVDVGGGVAEHRVALVGDLPEQLRWRGGIILRGLYATPAA